MESMLKTLIIITLIYYLLKGLIYLLLWQTTYKIEEHARAKKKQQKRARDVEKEIWETDQEEDS